MFSGTPLSAARHQFMLALTDPFHPAVVGVRVPDAVCYPTMTAMRRVQIPVTSDASGNISAAFFPLPHISGYTKAGVFSGSALNVFVANGSVFGVMTEANLAALFSVYRVASWGIRIILADTNASAKGTYTMAPFMTRRYMPDARFLQSQAASVANLESDLGIPATGAAIVNLPGAVVIGAQDFLARGEVVGSTPPYTAAAYSMKSTDIAREWSGTQNRVNTLLLNSSSNAIEASSFQENAETQGMMGMLLYGAGLPASTTEINVEMIYHLEGVPLLQNQAMCTSQPSPPGTTEVVESSTSRLHSYMNYFKQGEQYLDGFSRFASTGMQLYGRFEQGRRMYESVAGSRRVSRITAFG